MTPTFTTLLSFDQTYVNAYSMSLVQGFDGNLYGTTQNGGAFNAGSIFEITPAGTLTTLHSFDPTTDGYYPYSGLVQATNGNLYGTTFAGGVHSSGTVFEITPGGRLTTLHSFDLFIDGGTPIAGLVQATNGNFYGTTNSGGAYSFGTIFEITPEGKFTNLHSFDGTDGSFSQTSLVQATNGNLYGVTLGGGASYFSGGGFLGEGAFFEITTGGRFTLLYSFGVGHADGGIYPYGALIQATDGNLYGTTDGGGAYDFGTVFQKHHRGHGDHAVQLRRQQ